MPRQPHRAAAVAPDDVDEADQLLVDAAGEHHLDDAHGLLVGDAHAVDEARLHAQLVEHVGDLRPAAVDDDRVQPDELQEHDVAAEALAQARIVHRVAAVLDDDRLAAKFLDVGQRLDEDGGFLDGGEPLVAHAADSSTSYGCCCSTARCSVCCASAAAARASADCSAACAARRIV